MKKIMDALSYKFSPNIRVAMDHKDHHPYVLERRAIFDYELLYMAHGSLNVTIEDRNFILRPGDLLIIKPGIQHSFYSITDGVVHMPHLHLDLIYYDDFDKVYTSFKPLELFTEQDNLLIRPDLLSDGIFKLPEHISLNNPEEIYKIIMDIIKIHTQEGILYRIKEKELCSKLFYMIFHEMFMKSDPSLEKFHNNIQKVHDLIEENLEKDLSLQQLAKYACLSEFHLERVFKKLYGQPVKQYQLKRRMEKAKLLLQYSQCSISEIATKVGYSSVHSFSKAFRKTFGLSPRDFIKKSVEKVDELVF